MKNRASQAQPERSLEEIKDLLRRRFPELREAYGVASVEIFGSWVRGEQTGSSDLDLLVEFNPVWKVSLFDLVSLEQELSSYLGVPVDLVEKTSVKPALRQRIFGEAAPL